MPLPRLTTRERFWGSVQKTDACWLWTRGTFSSGYGCFKAGGTNKTAHRYAWELEHGPIPAGMFVCHKCDVRRCVNPGHLFLGTHRDNMRDMADKGRAAVLKAKLTPGEVRTIKRMLASGHSARNVAAVFEVSHPTVFDIKAGRSWRLVLP